MLQQLPKTIPKIPKKLPCLDVSGDDKPLRAKINSTPEIKYNDAARLDVIIYFTFYFSFFLYICSILCVTKKPPNIFIAANKYCRKSKHIGEFKNRI